MYITRRKLQLYVVFFATIVMLPACSLTFTEKVERALVDALERARLNGGAAALLEDDTVDFKLKVTDETSPIYGAGIIVHAGAVTVNDESGPALVTVMPFTGSRHHLDFEVVGSLVDISIQYIEGNKMKTTEVTLNKPVAVVLVGLEQPLQRNARDVYAGVVPYDGTEPVGFQGVPNIGNGDLVAVYAGEQTFETLHAFPPYIERVPDYFDEVSSYYVMVGNYGQINDLSVGGMDSEEERIYRAGWTEHLGVFAIAQVSVKTCEIDRNLEIVDGQDGDNFDRFTGKESTSIEYDTNHNVAKIMVTYVASDDGVENTSSYVYRHDENNRLVFVKEMHSESGAVFEKRYTYDDTGNLVEEYRSRSIVFNDEDHSIEWVVTRNSLGQKTQWEYTHKDDAGVAVTKETETFDYDENGGLEKQERIGYIYEDGKSQIVAHSIREYEYDEQGKLVRTEEDSRGKGEDDFFVEIADGTPDVLETYTYNDENLLVTIELIEPDTHGTLLNLLDDNEYELFELTTHTTLSYNAKNRLIKAEVDFDSYAAGVDVRRMLKHSYTYHGNGIRKETIQHEYVDGNLQKHSLATFDERERLIAQRIDHDGDGNFDSETEMRYEGENLLERKFFEYDEAESQRIPRLTINYTYDDQNRVLKMDQDGDEEPDGYDDETVEYTYDDSGQMIKRNAIYYNHNGEGGAQINSRSLAFDKKNRVLSIDYSAFDKDKPKTEPREDQNMTFDYSCLP